MPLGSRYPLARKLGVSANAGSRGKCTLPDQARTNRPPRPSHLAVSASSQGYGVLASCPAIRPGYLALEPGCILTQPLTEFPGKGVFPRSCGTEKPRKIRENKPLIDSWPSLTRWKSACHLRQSWRFRMMGASSWYRWHPRTIATNPSRNSGNNRGHWWTMSVNPESIAGESFGWTPHGAPTLSTVSVTTLAESTCRSRKSVLLLHASV